MLSCVACGYNCDDMPLVAVHLCRNSWDSCDRLLLPPWVSHRPRRWVQCPSRRQQLPHSIPHSTANLLSRHPSLRWLTPDLRRLTLPGTTGTARLQQTWWIGALEWGRARLCGPLEGRGDTCTSSTKTPMTSGAAKWAAIMVGSYRF